MNPAILKIKEEQKLLAVEIRKLKAKVRVRDARWKDKKDLWKKKFTFRHRHIAYCTLRGRKREEIEIPAKDNKPNEIVIKKYLDEFTSLLEEVKKCA